MNGKIQRIQEDIDLMLSQQIAEMRYFRKVNSETAAKTTALYIREIQLDNEDRARRK